MTYSDGQRLTRSQVEPWISEQYARPHFVARVTEQDAFENGDFGKPYLRVIVRITGPNGERITNALANNQEAVYFSAKKAAVMLPQAEAHPIA